MLKKTTSLFHYVQKNDAFFKKTNGDLAITPNNSERLRAFI
jgi:hypothetical protein